MNEINPAATGYLQFLAERESPALYLAAEAGGEIKDHQGNYAIESVPIWNGRAALSKTNIEHEGFVLVNQHSEVKDFYSDQQVEAIYLAELQALIREQFVAVAHMEVFDYTRRTSGEALRKERNLRETANIVHNDYSELSGNRVRSEFFDRNPSLIKPLAEKDFAIVNVWRSIGGTVLQKPLTICDVSTVDPADVIAVTRQAKDRVGELQLATYSPQQRWYYYPRNEYAGSIDV